MARCTKIWDMPCHAQSDQSEHKLVRCLLGRRYCGPTRTVFHQPCRVRQTFPETSVHVWATSGCRPEGRTVGRPVGKKSKIIAIIDVTRKRASRRLLSLGMLHDILGYAMSCSIRPIRVPVGPLSLGRRYCGPTRAVFHRPCHIRQTFPETSVHVWRHLQLSLRKAQGRQTRRRKFENHRDY